MKIRLFKHAKVISTVGIIKYHRFKKVFERIINEFDEQLAINKIKDLMARCNFDFMDFEVPNENSYYFIIIGTWYNDGTIN